MRHKTLGFNHFFSLISVEDVRLLSFFLVVGMGLVFCFGRFFFGLFFFLRLGVLTS